MAEPRHSHVSPGPGSARGDGGAAAVEMAIVLPLLLLILFGIIDMGRMLQQQITLTGAVREAARVGALNGSQTQMQNQVKTIVGSTAVGFTTTHPCTTASTLTDTSNITATRAFAPITPLAGIQALFSSTPVSTTYTLRATGVMACLG